jgi:hypothetical protein
MPSLLFAGRRSSPRCTFQNFRRTRWFESRDARALCNCLTWQRERAQPVHAARAVRHDLALEFELIDAREVPKSCAIYFHPNSCLQLTPVADLKYDHIVSQSSRVRPIGHNAGNRRSHVRFRPRSEKRFEEGRQERRRKIREEGRRPRQLAVSQERRQYSWGAVTAISHESGYCET